jgi:acyl carrier protein
VTDVDGRIAALLTENLGLPADRISDDVAMKDVGSWDSLKHMELIVAIETAFDLQLSFDEIVTMTSVGEIKRVVREKCAVG